MYLQKMLKDWLTENDNETYCPMRFGGLLGIICFLALSFIEHNRFDPITFGAGFGAMIAAWGAGLKFRKSTEPTK